MRRDIGNEVIVAIAVIGILAFAITFGVILSLSSGAEVSTPTAISQAEDTATETNVATVTATLTETPIEPTETAIEPTQTSQPTTVTVSETPHPTTEEEASVTPTPRRSTPTPTLTSTAIPTLTRTPRPTPTKKPTRAPTEVTETAVESTPSATSTKPAPTDRPTLPSPTPSKPAPTAIPPTATLQPTTAILPTFPPDSGVEGCTDARVQITSLYPGQPFSGNFALAGTANAEDFVSYKIEIRPEALQVFNFYSQADKPVSNGLLGTIDARLFAPGRYWIRLSVQTQSDASPTPCTIPVVFQ